MEVQNLGNINLCPEFALKCIDQVIVIWSEYCDISIEPSENSRSKAEGGRWKHSIWVTSGRTTTVCSWIVIYLKKQHLT